MNEHELYRLIADNPQATCCINSQVIGVKPNGETLTALINIPRDNALRMLQGFARDYADTHYCIQVVRDECGAAKRIIFGAPYINMRIVDGN